MSANVRTPTQVKSTIVLRAARPLRPSMKYKDLRDFTARLEGLGELRRISQSVSPVLEMTELSDRVLRSGGPALLFERPAGHSIPVLANLFGTPRRVALGMGIETDAQGSNDSGLLSDTAALESLRNVGRLLVRAEGTGAAEGAQGRGKAAVAREGRVGHGAENREFAAVPGNRVGRPGRRPDAPADPDLLARRRRSARHVGPDRHARAATRRARISASTGSN